MQQLAHLRHASDGSARSHSGQEDIHVAVQLSPYLRAGSLAGTNKQQGFYYKKLF